MAIANLAEVGWTVPDGSTSGNSSTINTTGASLLTTTTTIQPPYTPAVVITTHLGNTLTLRGSVVYTGNTELDLFDCISPTFTGSGEYFICTGTSGSGQPRNAMWSDAWSGTGTFDATAGFVSQVNIGTANMTLPTFTPTNAGALMLVGENNIMYPSTISGFGTSPTYSGTQTNSDGGTVCQQWWQLAVASTSYTVTLAQAYFGDKSCFIAAYNPAGGGTSYSLTAGQGTYGFTGEVAKLLRGRKVIAAQGSYAETGEPAGLKYGRKLAATQGSYALTGEPAGLLFKRILTAAQGSYAMTGVAAGLRKGRTLLAACGTYVMTGEAAGLAATRKMLASGGTYALTGFAAGLHKGRTLLAAAGSYALSGQSAALARTRVMQASTGTYSLLGQAVAFTRTTIFGWTKSPPASTSWTPEGETPSIWTKIF